MEFANHFGEIHSLVLPNTTTFGYQILIIVDVSSFEVSEMADASDMNDEI